MARVGVPSGRWTYYDVEGSEVFIVFRFDGSDGKTYRPVHPTPEGWAMGDPPGLLPLYRLPEWTDARRIFVGEREKLAELLTGLGLDATTSAHGAKSPHKTDWRPTAGRELILVLNNNPEGEAYETRIKALVAKIDPQPRVRIVRLSDLWRMDEPIPEGGDVEEWLANGVPDSWTPEQCRTELERVADQAPLEDLDGEVESSPKTGASGVGDAPDWTSEPKPVRYELRPVPILEPRMIPGPLRAWLADIAERVGCPLDFPGAAAIVALSIVLGRRIAIRPKRHDDWSVVPNLWGGIVGRPGVMKTSALSEATKPIRRLEADARERHERARVEFQTALLVASVQADAAKAHLKKAANKNESRDVLESLARDATLAAPLPEPKLVRYTTSDPTVEALGELLRDNPNGIGLVRDELPGWLQSFDRSDRECDRAFYLEAWAGNGPLFTYDRIGRGTILIPNPCVSILGGMQPGPLRSLLRGVVKCEESDDGLISRFQVLVWPDTSADWKNVDRWPDATAKNRAYAIFEALNSVDPADAGAILSDEDDPPFLRFDPEAREFFDAWRLELELRLRVPNESPLIESHFFKYRSLMPSLACLFHLVETVDGGGSGPVGMRSARLAVEWCQHPEAHARRVYGCVTDSDLEPARALSEKIKAGVLPSPFAPRDVYRRCWSHLDDADSVRRAVARARASAH